MSFTERISNIVESSREEAISIRRELHKNPEKSGLEMKTTLYIKEKLQSWGIEVIDKPFETGLAAKIYGRSPGKTICFRADIDALPEKELSGLAFAAEGDVCHCCGHDIHTTICLMCAKYLQQFRTEWNGTVEFIFQPSEETGKGAKYMIENGVLDILQPDMILALHCWPELKVGKIGLKNGNMMAASDSIRIRVNGKAGHGAHPYNCVDPILISSYIVQQVQTIISRECRPVDAAVISIGKINGGTTDNSIPAFVEMEGTARTLKKEDRELIRKALKRIVENTAAAMGGSGEVEIHDDGAPLICDADIVEKIRLSAEAILEDSVVMLEEPSMGMEDFSYYLENIPGAYFRLGTANHLENSREGLHSPSIIFDETAIEIGCKIFLQFVAMQQ